MGSTRLISSLIVGVVAAAGCGSGDESIASRSADRPVTTVEEGGIPQRSGVGPLLSFSFHAAIQLGGTDDLGPLPTDDIGFVFDEGLSPDDGVIADLAAALGVEGPVVDHRADGSLLRVGSVDGSGPVVLVEADDPDLPWNYHWAWVDAEAWPCEIVDGPPPLQGFRRPAAEQECPEPAWTPEVPGTDEAIDLARDLLEVVGADVDDARFWVRDFGDVARVMAWDDETPIGRLSPWWFEFGNDGQLVRADGSLRSPTTVGPYPLVDLDAALDRLRRGGDDFAARIGGAALDRFDPDDWMAPAAGDALALPRLVDVEADLWELFDSDGVRWLLPAYRFVDEEGGWYTVVAVEDDVISFDFM